MTTLNRTRVGPCSKKSENTASNRERTWGEWRRIRWLERGSRKMSKRPKPFEYKGKKKIRLPRESLWRDGLSFLKWWRRGESNPRPRALRHKIYMLIPCFDLTAGYPTGQENQQRFRLSLTLQAPN